METKIVVVKSLDEVLTEMYGGTAEPHHSVRDQQPDLNIYPSLKGMEICNGYSLAVPGGAVGESELPWGRAIGAFRFRRLSELARRK